MGPARGTRVGLQLPCCGARLHASRVTDVDPDAHAVEVEPPHEHPSGAPSTTPATGDPVVVGWHVPGGWVELAGTLVDVPPHGEWSVRLAPLTSTPDRRGQVRVGESGAVEVGHDAPTMPGRIIDLSEAGMRCVVRPRQSLEVGDEIVVVFALDTGSVTLDAAVVRAGASSGGTEVGLRFGAHHRADLARVRDHVAGRVARLRSAAVE